MVAGKKQNYDEYQKIEVAAIEHELKDWFLSRRLDMERNLAIKKELDRSNFTGLSLNNLSVPATQKVIWGDLVSGKPELEDSLSQNARKMKATMYLQTFRGATDMDHICRIPGSVYLRCLRDNSGSSLSERSSNCASYFGAFDNCRKGLLARQADALEKSMMRQDIADHRAKALFERRSILMDTIG